MSKLSKSRKQKVWYRDNFTCHYCGKKVHSETYPGRATVDHKKPLVKGGTNDFDNLVTACEKCNSKKGELDYENFIEFKIKQRVFIQKFYDQQVNEKDSLLTSYIARMKKHSLY